MKRSEKRLKGFIGSISKLYIIGFPKGKKRKGKGKKVCLKK